jgi:hypothetical protein
MELISLADLVVDLRKKDKNLTQMDLKLLIRLSIFSNDF